ncbi:unnamed protein product [Rangifer tarandus platyrhynchus]|uniref:Uncharacterized protein n=2 Tax=Rangifer tarandus platyrhynchus TaxID=3082113 RepID=A0ACB0DZ99_RANTA|nr:unnamed protein product [Rangifer tarandus platyrhynchus]CAI9693538.1 unnamed protein product [Rangifer tarandus platyrhynchus]
MVHSTEGALDRTQGRAAAERAGGLVLSAESGALDRSAAAAGGRLPAGGSPAAPGNQRSAAPPRVPTSRARSCVARWPGTRGRHDRLPPHL